MPSFKDALDLLKASFKEWSDDGATRLGAALAYYTLFSLAPLLLLITRLLGAIWGGQPGDVQLEVIRQAEDLVGEQGAEGIQMMLDNANQSGDAGTVATIVSAVVLVFGATGLFAALQGALNVVWDVEAKPGQALKTFVKTRLLSFGMIVMLGFLLLTSLVATAAVAVLSDWLFARMPGGEVLTWVADLVVSFGIIMLLFALIYKVLPDVEIEWRDVLVGAAVTSALFLIGKYLIGFYLGQSSTASSYGAAGSLVVLLVWIYYSSQLVFFGAEFTQVWAKRYGKRIVPAPHAQRLIELTPDELAQIQASRSRAEAAHIAPDATSGAFFDENAASNATPNTGDTASASAAEPSDADAAQSPDDAGDADKADPPTALPTSGYLGDLDAPPPPEPSDDTPRT